MTATLSGNHPYDPYGDTEWSADFLTETAYPLNEAYWPGPTRDSRSIAGLCYLVRGLRTANSAVPM